MCALEPGSLLGSSNPLSMGYLYSMLDMLDMQNISDICVSKNVKDSGSLTRRNSKMVRNYVFYWGGFLWGKFIWVNYLTCCMSGLGCAYQQFRLLYCALEKLRSYEFRSYVWSIYSLQYWLTPFHHEISRASISLKTFDWTVGFEN